MDETLKRRRRSRAVLHTQFAEDVLELIEMLAEETKAKVKIIEIEKPCSRHLGRIVVVDEVSGREVSVDAANVIEKVPRIPRVQTYLSRSTEIRKVQVPLIRCIAISSTQNIPEVRKIGFPLIPFVVRTTSISMSKIRVPCIFVPSIGVSTSVDKLLIEQRLRYVPSYSRVKARISKDLIPVRVPTSKKCSVSITDRVRREVRALLGSRAFETPSLLYLVGGEELEKFVDSVAQGKVGEPVFIIVRKGMSRLWFLLWIVCREIYREPRGELPESIVFVKSKEDKEDFVNWLKYRGKFEGSIVVIDEEVIEDLDDREQNLLSRRVKEAYSQGLGFVILLSREPASCEQMVRELAKPYIPNITVVDITDTDLRERAKNIHKFLMLVFDPGKEFIEKPPDIDTDVAVCDRMYRDFIRSLLSETRSLIHAKRDIAEESEDHLALKVLAYKYLRDQLGVSQNRICMTKEIDNIVVDVYAETEDGKKIAIEIETLFGVGPAPLLKIIDTIRKYLESEERAKTKIVDELWIVVPNWVAALHLPKLLYIKEMLGEELRKKGIELRMLVPSIATKSLKDIEYLGTGISKDRNRMEPNV